jgi:hypothetical protein
MVRGGRLQNYINEWQEITNDEEILNAVIGYCIPFKELPPIQVKEPRGLDLSDVEISQLDECIISMLEIRAISKVDPCLDQFVSSVFVVPKPDGTGRFIINLKELNDFVDSQHFKMEDHRLVKQLLQKDFYMAKLDLKDAYYLLPIATQHRKYLRFRFKGQLYEFNCLPFGLCTGPRIFTKIIRPVVACLRKKGHISINYLDDFLLMANNASKCKQNINATIEVLVKLGFVVNVKKSILLPSKEVEYLGFIFNSSNMTLSLPERKKEKILKLISRSLLCDNDTIENLAILIGNLISATPAIDYGMLHTRYLEIDKTNALFENEGNFSSKMKLSTQAKDELVWWKKVIPKGLSRIRNDSFDFEITTDASPTGWGAHTGDSITRGFWSVTESSLHINILELLGAFNGIKSLISPLKGSQILIRTDSTTAKAYINRQGGCHSEENLKIATKIWKWCEENDMWIVAAYINTKENVIADKASREEVDQNDFALDMISFDKIVTNFGNPKIDLFASSHTKKCTRFYSWFPDPECEGVDAFSFVWKDFFYAFPPFSLIPRVLRKVISDKARGIIVVPNWETQAWFPIFKNLKCSKTLKLQPNKFSLCSPFSDRPHPLSKTLCLLVAIVSG